MWYSKWLSGVQVQARPKSFTSQSQQQRRQLYPTRPLEGRSSGRRCTNHFKGAPLSFARTGRFGPPGFAGWFAVAGAVVELLLVSVSASIILNRIVPARLIPTPHVLPTRQQLPQHHIRLTVSLHSLAALTGRDAKTRRRESLGGIWNPFPVPSPNIHLPPDSPSLRPRADIPDPAYDQVPPAITQQIFGTLRYAFARTDLPPDTLRGVVLHHTERTSRNTPEVVAETPSTVKMAETMSPIGIANVRITNHTIARLSPDANST